jgi:hypothetical protein
VSENFKEPFGALVREIFDAKVDSCAGKGLKHKQILAELGTPLGILDDYVDRFITEAEGADTSQEVGHRLIR